MEITGGLSLPVRPAETVFDQGRQAVETAIGKRDLVTAAHAFESYFLTYVMKVMRETVPKGGLLNNRMGEVYYAFLDQEIGKRAAEGGGIGLSEMILSALADTVPDEPANRVPR